MSPYTPQSLKVAGFTYETILNFPLQVSEQLTIQLQHYASCYAAHNAASLLIFSFFSASSAKYAVCPRVKVSGHISHGISLRYHD
ncbi:MAG: hypothetical protein KKC77_14905, partial [Proteobacteria bacterium]|nr:hypothetical protein [Pseudomonadota bacterium]